MTLLIVVGGIVVVCCLVVGGYTGIKAVKNKSCSKPKFPNFLSRCRKGDIELSNMGSSSSDGSSSSSSSSSSHNSDNSNVDTE